MGAGIIQVHGRSASFGKALFAIIARNKFARVYILGTPRFVVGTRFERAWFLTCIPRHVFFVVVC